MGCYDTIYIRCPECNHINKEQSKASKCKLEVYTIATAPLSIIADILDRGNRGNLYCERCKIKYTLQVQRLIEVITKPVEDED